MGDGGDTPMRLIMSVFGLLAVVAITGLLSKRQLATVPMLSTSPGASASAPVSPAQQSQQLQQHYRQAIEDAMRQPRPRGDEAP